MNSLTTGILSLPRVRCGLGQLKWAITKINTDGFGAGEFETVLNSPLVYGIDACLEGSLNKRHPFTTARYGKIIYKEGRLGKVAKTLSNGINLDDEKYD